MGPRERREREREEIRTRILDAARELFATEGYEAVTMRRIAERIEYSATAIYFHFRDKEALVNELCDVDFAAFAQVFQQIAHIEDPIARLRAAGHAYVAFGLSHPNHFRVMFMTPHPEQDPAGSAIEKGNPDEDAYAFVRTIVEQAIAAKRFRTGIDNIDLVAQTVWAGVHGVIALEIAKGCDKWLDWQSLEQRANFMVDCLIDSLTPPATTAVTRTRKRS